jgi:hypothetical protein
MSDDNEPDYDPIDDIDIDDTEQTVLIRVVEWTEWMPGKPDQTNMLNVHNGITGLATSKSEKLVDVGITGLNRNLDFEEELECEECEGTGQKRAQPPEEQFKKPEQTPPMQGPELRTCEKCEGGGFIKNKVHYGLYAFQVTLAQNVSPNVLQALQLAQNTPILEEFERQKTQGRDRRSDLTIVEHKAPPPPPRRKKKR